MEYVGVAELKAHLSRYLARVKAGEEIIVADRGRPVARLVPAIPTDAGEEEARLRDLERRGIVRMGTGRIPDEFWQMERPEDPEGLVRAALEEERSEGW
jgi:prevent-host-death family protein